MKKANGKTGFFGRIAKDKSLRIFGVYVRSVPYKGYKRFKSKEWNIKNTLK